MNDNIIFLNMIELTIVYWWKNAFNYNSINGT